MTANPVPTASVEPRQAVPAEPVVPGVPGRRGGGKSAAAQNAGASAGALFHLIRTGQASSRAELARLSGVSASTVAMRVEELIAAGYLEETGKGESTGGRKPRSLSLKVGNQVVVGIDLGEHHASLGVMDRRARLIAQSLETVSLIDGPEAVVRQLVERSRALVAEAGEGLELAGIAMGLPGPVDSRTGKLVAPSRMPGWNGVAVRELLESYSGLPARVDNDANIMALGEYVYRGQNIDNLVFVKAGTGIGCGVIASGALHRGFRGIAGDISHVSLSDAEPIPCSCGRLGCLDVIASGSAILDSLREEGVEVESMNELIAIASDAHPLATRYLRDAGRRTGEVLATIVNFFNPEALVLGGKLSQSEAFVAGVRQAIYTQCLPMATDFLDVSVSEIGWTGGVQGIGWALLEEIVDPARIDAELRTSGS